MKHSMVVLSMLLVVSAHILGMDELTMRQKYTRLVEGAMPPVLTRFSLYTYLSDVRKIWTSEIEDGLYDERTGGLRNVYRSLLLGTKPYSSVVLHSLISVQALPLIAYMQKKYGNGQPFEFVEKPREHSWENPVIGQYEQVGGKVIQITFYSLLYGLLETIESIQTEIRNGSPLSSVQNEFFQNAVKTVYANLAAAVAPSSGSVLITDAMVAALREKYATLLNAVTVPVYADLAHIRDAWDKKINNDLYDERTGGLRNVYRSLLLGTKPYSATVLPALISPQALQLIAYMQKKYGNGRPFEFTEKPRENAWENPVIGQYEQVGGKVINVTFYSLLHGVLEIIEQIRDESKKGLSLPDSQKESLRAAIQSLSANLDSAIQNAHKQVVVAPENTQELAYFTMLVAACQKVDGVTPFPTTHNRIKNIAGTDQAKQRTIAQQAQAVRPIIDERVLKFIDAFLVHKRQYGTAIEKGLYVHLNRDALIDRFFVNRPMMFMNTSDQYLLRNAKTGSGGFDRIGTPQEQSPLVLRDYMSYDEMQIAALLGVSVPTYFINNGSRNNGGQPAHDAGTYQEQGVYVGLVGARFERPGLMEWQHMIVTPEQNIESNGYGKNPIKNTPQYNLLALWSSLYGHTFFTYQEAQKDMTGRFIKVQNQNAYLDTVVYKERMKLVLKPFFLDANDRARATGIKAYCHIVGLGLGVWQIDARQADYMIQACGELLAVHNLSSIADIDFSWFPDQYKAMDGVPNGGKFTKGGSNIIVHFSKRNPADKLVGVDKDKLLVAMYAWDGNSYPGNEYWAGMLTASGDPAAACCSTIAELQNPLINPNVSSKKLFIAR